MTRAIDVDLPDGRVVRAYEAGSTAPEAPTVTPADSAASASAEALRAALTPEQRTASAKALFVKIKAIGGKCEGYGRNLAAGQKLNLTKTRQQFSEGRAACTEAAAELRKVGVPDYVVSQERREDMQAALEEIADAYAAKSDAFARFGDDSDIDDAISVVAPAVQRAHADLSSALREVKILSYDEGVDSAAFAE